VDERLHELVYFIAVGGVPVTLMPCGTVALNAGECDISAALRLRRYVFQGEFLLGELRPIEPSATQRAEVQVC
jgi:hypothetical protein